MNDSTIATMLSSLLSLGLILGLWGWYKAYRVDRFRSEMFQIRDELFDYAADGNIPFKHPAYDLARSTMNGFIRFGNRLSFLGALLVHFRLGKELAKAPDSFHVQFTAAVEALEDEQKRALEEFVFRMNVVVFRQLLLTSPMVLIVVAVLWAAALVWSVGRAASRPVLALRTAMAEWGGGLDSMALSLGGMQYA